MDRMRLGLGSPAVLVVSDGSGDHRRVTALGNAAAAGGAWGFQLREPKLGGRELARIAGSLASTSLRLIVNDRVDVALATGAFGVELGEQSLPAARVRALAGDGLGIGRSVHDAPGARAASKEGADWLIFGHVFATASKPGLPPAGLAGLRAACGAAACPVFAIGGINTGNAAQALAAGAAGVAVIGAVAGAADPEAAVRALVREVAGRTDHTAR